MDQNSFKSPYLTLSVERSFLVGVYKEDLEINLNIAQEMVRQRLQFMNGNNYPAIFDVRKVKSINKEARDYFARGDGVKGITAVAVLVESYVSLMIGNIFITFSRPEVPTRLFKNKEHALKWLNQYKILEDNIRF